MKTRQDLLDALTVERFTHLPQHPRHARPPDGAANLQALTHAITGTRSRLAPVIPLRSAS